MAWQGKAFSFIILFGYFFLFAFLFKSSTICFAVCLFAFLFVAFASAPMCTLSGSFFREWVLESMCAGERLPRRVAHGAASGFLLHQGNSQSMLNTLAVGIILSEQIAGMLYVRT